MSRSLNFPGTRSLVIVPLSEAGPWKQGLGLVVVDHYHGLYTYLPTAAYA